MKKMKVTELLIVFAVVFTAAAYTQSVTGTQVTVYKVGDRGPAGGWIFYDKGKVSDGWRYLEAAPEDQSAGISWGCEGIVISGAQGTAIGTGKANTQAIIRGCAQAENAAKICIAYRGGGKNDWFLPSKDELDAVYKNLYDKGVDGFASETYWTSSESNGQKAWLQYFLNGIQDNNDKSANSTRVRAVRAF